MKKVFSLAIGLLFVAGVAHADIGVLATSNAIQNIACDGTTDDSTNMQTLINGLQALASSTTGADVKNRTYITFPANATCKFNSGLTINGEKLGLAGDGTVFDFSGLTTAGLSGSYSLGTGNGTTTQFFAPSPLGTGGLPVKSGSFTVTAGAVTGTDTGVIDNLGNDPVTGTGIAAGVNSALNIYNGIVLVNFAVAPPAATPVSATLLTFAPAITITTTSNPYGSSATVWRGIHMIGPGQNTATIGLEIEGAGVNLDKPVIHDFGVGVGTLTNAYLLKMNQPTLYNTQVAYNQVNGSDSGEQMTITGGQIFNSGHGVMYAGEVTAYGTSLDFFSSTAIAGGGVFRGYGLHFEGNATSGVPVMEQGSCNAFGQLLLRDATILIDGNPSTTNALVSIDGAGGGQFYLQGCNGNGKGGYVKITDSFINGFNASALSCAFGSSPRDCVIGTATSVVNSAHLPLVSLCDNTTGNGGGSPNNLSNTGWCR